METLIDRAKRWVDLYNELQQLTANLYPGHEIQVVPEQRKFKLLEEAHSHGTLIMGPPAFTALSGVKQIAQIMKERKKPIEKRVLLAELKRRGSKVGKDTLTSYLSREPIFQSVSRGVWALREPQQEAFEMNTEK